MRHKTWFRLVIKAIGVLLIGISLQSVVSGVIALVVLTLSLFDIPIDISYSVIGWQYYLGGALMAIFGLYLFFGGKWIVNKCIPSNRPYCPECGYDLSKSSASANCPECGVVLPKSSKLGVHE